MRLALAGSAILAVYAVLGHVTYLNTGGPSSAWPEYRRIEVVTPAECGEILDRANRTLGENSGITCDLVPNYRHWSNVVRAAYETGGAASVASLFLGGEAVASAAPTPTAATIR